VKRAHIASTSDCGFRRQLEYILGVWGGTIRGYAKRGEGIHLHCRADSGKMKEHTQWCLAGGGEAERGSGTSGSWVEGRSDSRWRSGAYFRTVITGRVVRPPSRGSPPPMKIPNVHHLVGEFHDTGGCRGNLPSSS
jgi:hypothetical protein